MTVLLTGATGFIGKALVKKMLSYSNYKVIALSSCEIDGVSTILHNDYKFDKQYLVKHGAADVEVLIHMGAFTPKSSSESNDIDLSFSNVLNTKILLESFLPKLKKIIYISTLDVYSTTDKISEQTIPEPISLYGHSKLYCEHMVRQFGRDSGIETLILRLGHVFGPGEGTYKKLIPSVINNVLKGQPVQIYNGGSDHRNYIFIDDVVQAIINAIDFGGQENVINITGNETLSVAEIITMIETIHGNKVIREYINNQNISRDILFDNTLLKNTLLSDFTPVITGLKKEYEYMAKQL